MRYKFSLIISVLTISLHAVLFGGCPRQGTAGDPGPAGPIGPAGKPGAIGPTGSTGVSGIPTEYAHAYLRGSTQTLNNSQPIVWSQNAIVVSPNNNITFNSNQFSLAPGYYLITYSVNVSADGGFPLSGTPANLVPTLGGAIGTGSIIFQGMSTADLRTSSFQRWVTTEFIVQVPSGSPTVFAIYAAIGAPETPGAANITIKSSTGTSATFADITIVRLPIP